MARTSAVKTLARWLGYGLAGVLVLVVAVLITFRFVDPPTSSFMLQDDWQHSHRDTRQIWVDIEAISLWMPLAVIASEDQRFFSHWGLDLNAIRSAVTDYRNGDSLRGASTLSQQTAKNLFLWNGRQMVRKVIEAGLTLGLEMFWSKRRIMEVYLNIAEFGDGIYGVEAASRHFFGVSASQLSATQAARLAAVLPNPKRLNAGQPSAYIWQRVHWIIGQMNQLGGVYHVRPHLR
ncbi:monofunctional biosynthetic peptidoglycan transglycosylase [Marinobacter caseinilyticus]|uniref:monofunctional biosynthetic peptidoglycan transglycosylase n=1 Tax=Marinobacter caseinilyticus TaxID=2692195 RepID=UPI00140D67E6|nr:monofunctional biosynthetic peptidoglycan transglycosylase [Marinobacter caseinilyticus]